MPINIARHFDDELNAWNDTLHFYLTAIHVLEKNLGEIITRNSVVDIAAKVEVHQLLLDNITNKMKLLQVEISNQKLKLKIANEFISDTDISEKLDLDHAALLSQVKSLEKEFIDLKYYCNTFLSDILKQ